MQRIRNPKEETEGVILAINVLCDINFSAPLWAVRLFSFCAFSIVLFVNPEQYVNIFMFDYTVFVNAYMDER